LKHFLENNYVELRGNIDGANYPAPAHAQFLGKLAGYVQVAGVIMMMFGGSVFNALGYTTPPAWLTQMQENQMQVFMGLFMFSMVAANMQSTGAFEIILDEKVLFSKIDSGRMPTLDELVALLEDNGLTKTNGDSFGRV